MILSYVCVCVVCVSVYSVYWVCLNAYVYIIMIRSIYLLFLMCVNCSEHILWKIFIIWSSFRYLFAGNNDYDCLTIPCLLIKFQCQRIGLDPFTFRLPFFFHWLLKAANDSLCNFLLSLPPYTQKITFVISVSQKHYFLQK